MFTDNTFLQTDVPGVLDDSYASYEDALRHYLFMLVEKMDNAVGINFAAAVVEEGSHLHVHTIFWSAVPITFAYTKKMFPHIRWDDCKKRLSASLDYLHKRNGNEEKGHTNRSQVVEYGEYPVVIDVSVPTEWVNFVKAGHTYVQLIEAYPSALGRAWGLKAYINEMRGNDNAGNNSGQLHRPAAGQEQGGQGL